MLEVSTEKTPQRPKLIIRRGKKIIENVDIQIISSDIKSGQLKPSHEFSMDGVNWRRLDCHPELSKVFASIPRSKRKGLLVFLFLIILQVLVGLYCYPYWAFYNVQVATDSRNIQKLSQWVDYSDLNRDIKGQLDAQWSEVSVTKISKASYAELADLAGQTQVNKMVDALVTPEAVMDLVKGETDLIVSWARESSKAPAVGNSKGPLDSLDINNMESMNQVLDSVQGVLSQGEFRYLGINSFVATIETTNGESLDFVYERKGIDWKLSRITLPLERVRFSLNDIAQSALKKAKSKGRKGKKARKSRSR